MFTKKKCSQKNEQIEKLNIDYFGEYRMGLTPEEIKDYLLQLKNFYKIKMANNIMIKKFAEIAGANSGTITSTGIFLMYRHDVERYANVLFKQTKTTYWD